ncbi:LacI family DNA-binding transcriptional regulator [Roseomonas sp. OT10]|uniref:LacI family DNA-binding transcriptional regulator n=1 Tax=Roseomonas cutis TaxID=2897332 RepID=UPI001E51B257|nr:LacI family DNA-binding transcriptional regulator [Roseomonas sp. OT10]UFN48836.1 LacI family DNA-binding transcriptional regulator [Roseomonas sp. OT10]
MRIEDVARLAGVSAQTVSRVLRDPERVSEPVRASVRAAVAQAGYVPNLVAGSLASNRSRIVAIIVPTLANAVHAGSVEGLSDALHAARHEVLVGTTGYDRDRERAVVRAFLGRRVDGLAIAGGVLDPEAAVLLRAAAIPTVQLWELPEAPVDMAVGVRNREIGMAVARHLAGRGRRRLAVVGHAAASDTRAADRVAGFVAEAQRLGLPEPLRLQTARPSALKEAAALLEPLLRGAAPAEAVFCAGDQIAIGLLLGARRAGVAVPERLAIVGVGDSDLAALVSPALTTVRIPRYEMGFEAGRMLLRRLQGETVEPRRVDLGFELMVRESG